MAVPDFQTIMLPLLALAGDGQEHTARQAVDDLTQHFHLSIEDQQALLPSGTQRRFGNRVHWAISHLKQAGLLEYPRRGSFVITARGYAVLAQNPHRVDLRLLNQFPEFVAFRSGRNRNNGQSEPVAVTALEPETAEATDTPEEQFEAGYQRLREELAREVLERVRGCTPRFFERLVIEVLVAMGYGGSRRDAGQAIGRSGDEGIDGIIKEDRLGLDTIYIQAKRWQGTVGRPEIQRFVGALQGQRARKGVFITTSDFSREARDYAANIDSKVVLIDGEQLALLMIDHNVGVATTQVYELKRIDSDYFIEE